MDIDISKVKVGDIIPTEGGWLAEVREIDISDPAYPLLMKCMGGPFDGVSLWYCADGRYYLEDKIPPYKEHRLLHQWRCYPPEQRPQVGWKMLQQDGRIVEVLADDGDDYAPFLIGGMAWYKYKESKLICCVDTPNFQVINNIRYIGE